MFGHHQELEQAYGTLVCEMRGAVSVLVYSNSNNILIDPLLRGEGSMAFRE